VSSTSASPPVAPEPMCGSRHCITCGDDGAPMTVIAIDDSRGLALCGDDEGARFVVETALLEAVAVGERLLVHAGTAIVRVPIEDPQFTGGSA
jgi:hydrogenase maturation factor